MKKLMEFFRAQSKKRKEKAEIARLRRDLRDPQVGVKFRAALALAEKEKESGIVFLGAFLFAEDDDVRSKAIEALERLGSKAIGGLGQLVINKLGEYKRLQADMHYRFDSSRDYQAGQLSQAARRADELRDTGPALLSAKKESILTLVRFMGKIGDDTDVPVFKLISECADDREVREETTKIIEHLKSPGDK